MKPNSAIAAWIALVALCLAGPVAADESRIRVQVLWESPAPTTWQGSIIVDGGAPADVRPLGTAIDESAAFRVGGDRIDVLPVDERISDGCEFSIRADDASAIRATFVDPKAPNDSLDATLTVAEALENKSTRVSASGRSLTIRRAPPDRLVIEPRASGEIFSTGETVVCVSRHRVESTTAVAIDWRASLRSLATGAVVWSEERSAEAGIVGEAVELDWNVAMPEQDGAYRLIVEAFPRRFGSRFYRGEPLVVGKRDLVALSASRRDDAAPREILMQIRPGESTWRDRLRGASPMRWFGSDDPSSGEGTTRVEQEGETSWLALDPGATREFPLPPTLGKSSSVVEIDVAADEPRVIEVACLRGQGTDERDVVWRSAIVSPDLPVATRNHWKRETLRFALPAMSTEGLLSVRGAGETGVVKIAEIRVIAGETSPARDAVEAAASAETRSTTLFVEDTNWPARFVATQASVLPGPPRSTRFLWYEACTRLADYARREGYDTVCLPTIADGASLFPGDPLASPRLIEGPAVSPGDVDSPFDALELALAIFDREGVGVLCSVAPTVDESFDLASIESRWNDLLARTSEHACFAGLLLRIPAARLDVATTAQRADQTEIARFERALGVTVPGDTVARAAYLVRDAALWREWQATRLCDELATFGAAAGPRGVSRCIEFRSDAVDQGRGSDSVPASLALVERSGWTRWSRIEATLAGAQSISETGRFDLWIRRSSESVARPAASRWDALNERASAMEFASHDAPRIVESDGAFAPSLDADVANLRRTVSTLPREPFAAAPRRTPVVDDPLRVRMLRRGDDLWIAAVNLAPWSVRGAVEFSSPSCGTMHAIGDRRLAEPTVVGGAASWSFELAPFDLVVARFEDCPSEAMDWRSLDGTTGEFDVASLRAAADDLGRRFADAIDPARRPTLFRGSFDDVADPLAGWLTDGGAGAALRREPSEGGRGGALVVRPGGRTIRLTTLSIPAPRTGFATIALKVRGVALAAGARPTLTLHASSGDSSLATHVSAEVELTGDPAFGPDDWRQVYVPIENVPEGFWRDWHVAVEASGGGEIHLDEVSVLDGFPSPERQSAWRKNLAVAQYALREGRPFTAYEALDSPAMRTMWNGFADPTIAARVPVATPAVRTAAAPPAETEPAPGMMDRVRGWLPKPVFR